MKALSIAVLSLVCLAANAAPSRAELAYLENGNTLSIRGHRIEGESLVLTMRNGGEIVAGTSFVTRFEADEVPHDDPVAAPAVVPASAPQPAAAPYADIIADLSAQHGVPAELVHAVIQVESGYQEHARSARGAMGLMQLTPETARRFDVADPFDPKQNIDGGIRFLKMLLTRFPLRLALAAYNAGEGTVRRFRGIPPYAETRDYVARILKLVRK
jgi:soluble lytic murein transglycosylase-like protein